MSFEAISKAAQSGDANAQLQLGIAWMTGQGVPRQDEGQGRQWLARAAEGGNRDAQRFLGLIFLRGMDVVPDFARGLSLLEQASTGGDAEADYALASFLGGSREEAFDADKALGHLEAAAQANHPRACAHLAYCCQEGVLRPADRAEATRWFVRAARLGDPGAMLALAGYCAAGYALPQDHGRAYWLARSAAEKGWKLADEVAASLEQYRSGSRPANWLPAEQEIDPGLPGRLPQRKLRMVSWQPRVVEIDHLLSDFECAEIVQAANDHLLPSFIVDGEGKLGTNQIRTSHEVRLRAGIRNIVIRVVESRLADWSHAPVEHAEYPLVLRYEAGQSFEQHYDYFIPEKFVMGEGPLEFGGQRIATQLVYLNESFTGGETRFDRVGLMVRPARGKCLLFHNVLPNHNVDPLSRHTGMAIEKGVKWLLSRWIREIRFDQPARDISRDVYRSSSESD